MAFWSALLEEGMLYERWYPTHLFVPGHGDLRVPRDDTRALHALGVRRSEPGFLEKLASLHATRLDGPLAALLELAPTVPEEVEKVIAVLRRALSVTSPLRHLGECGAGLAPAGAPFTLLEHHGASFSRWQLELRAPLRLRVTVESADEQPSWSALITTPAGAQLAPLLDAFSERALIVRVDTVAALADG